jgi:alkanesulfonate monooxygenase SsuD/methylene tetrahydromethanopterin reductase-like flavin-dependent oxidoreductase (luciferase family)
MVGSIGPSVLAATLPHVDMWNSWYAWYGNTPQGLTELIAKLDRQAGATGRNPADIVKTAAVMVGAPGGTGRLAGDTAHAGGAALSGDESTVAESLRAFAPSGVAHIQLVVDPITLGSIEWLGGVLDRLDGSPGPG